MALVRLPLVVTGDSVTTGHGVLVLTAGPHGPVLRLR
jgi:hypothetical protein